LWAELWVLRRGVGLLVRLESVAKVAGSRRKTDA
jgi:hypothetical protein